MLKFLLFAGRLPQPVLYAIANLAYVLLLHVFKYRRKTVTRNLHRVFPDKTPAERQQLMRDFYRHLSQVLVEIPMLSSMTITQLQQHIRLDGVEHMQALAAKNQSFILMGAHQANWEWMFAILSHYCPCPMDALYRPIHQPGVDAFFQLIRTRFGAAMLPANDAPKGILRKRKRLGAFGMIADQTPRRRDPLCWLDFMGNKTAVVTGPDRIAQMTGYPVLFISCERQARGQYHCAIAPLVEAPYDTPDQVATAYMHAVEAQIRRQPACWLWSHRRWRFKAPASANPQYLP